jgi:hypothetical protein
MSLYDHARWLAISLALGAVYTVLLLLPKGKR